MSKNFGFKGIRTTKSNISVKPDKSNIGIKPDESNIGIKSDESNIGLKSDKSNIGINTNVSNKALVPIKSKKYDIGDKRTANNCTDDNTGQTYLDQDDYLLEPDPKTGFKIEVKNIIEIIIIILGIVLIILEKVDKVPKVPKKQETFKQAEFGVKYEELKETQRKFDELNKKYEGALKKLKEDAYNDGIKRDTSFHYKKH